VTTVLVELGAGPVGQTVALVLAQDPAPPDKGPEFGKASPVGLVVIVLLALATIVLIRSMTKRLRRLPSSFDEEAEGPRAPEAPVDTPPVDTPPVNTSPARVEVDDAAQRER
jgi:hypothetical protein